MTYPEIVQVIARLRKLESRGREVKCEVDGIRNLLREELQKRGTQEVKAGKYTVRETSYTRSQFDTKKFREQQPVAYDKYCKPITVKRIEVLG